MTTGRPPMELTDKIKTRLKEAIRKGAPYSIACNYAGIAETTFYKWKRDAKVGKNEAFAQFLQELKQDEGETALIWLQKIDDAMQDGQWQAAAWKLERRYYSEFSVNPVVREEVKKLFKDIKKLKLQQGANQNGKEIHTKSTGQIRE